MWVSVGVVVVVSVGEVVGVSVGVGVAVSVGVGECSKVRKPVRSSQCSVLGSVSQHQRALCPEPVSQSLLGAGVGVKGLRSFVSRCH